MNGLLLVTANDHWGRRAAQLAARRTNVLAAVNAGTTPMRIARLLWRRSISFSSVMKMFFAELFRPRLPASNLPKVVDNEDLCALAKSNGIQTAILFRAGLIVARRTLAEIDVLNVHCARLDGYGGLGSIPRALAAGALDQEATLHRVTVRIDEGEMLDVEPYRLDPRLTYRQNEDKAYAAGLVLLARTLDRLAPGKLC